jgi:hypothetical protein
MRTRPGLTGDVVIDEFDDPGDDDPEELAISPFIARVKRLVRARKASSYETSLFLRPKASCDFRGPHATPNMTARLVD